MTSLIDNIVYLYENKSRIYHEICDKSRKRGRTVINKLIGNIFFKMKEYLYPFVYLAKMVMTTKLWRNQYEDDEDCDFEIVNLDMIQKYSQI